MDSLEKTPTTNREIKMWDKAYWLGVFLLAASLVFLGWNFYPLLLEEGRYYLTQKDRVRVVTQKEKAALPVDLTDQSTLLVPVDEQFGLVIPKILANAKVIADVDPNNSREYQKALTSGVAQAKGSAKPGETGNVFIFSHSGMDFFEANRYNAVFYLLDKLEKGDEVLLFYQGKKISYAVAEKKTVSPDEVQYMQPEAEEKIVTLMTCWPAGTELKRLVVIAKQID